MATAQITRTTDRRNVRTTDAAAPPLVGRLGPWQLVRLLSEGNLTRVYLARPDDRPAIVPFPASTESEPEAEKDDERAEGDGYIQGSPRPAAYVVKLLKSEWWRDPRAIEMQRREAWVGSKASHPNLLPVLSASVGEPPFYIVTPKLDGAPLAERLAQRGALAVPAALWIARQVADGLDALLKAAGVIHTDVNPNNILVSPSGHATLCDFGFAQTPAEASHWETRPLAGTLAYLAPEMFTSALAADAKSDLYSLGVTLFEMFTGRRPWESDDPAELATLHRETRPPDVRDFRSEVPAPVAELVGSMLAKDPLRRPGSARELSERLVQLEIDSFTLR